MVIVSLRLISNASQPALGQVPNQDIKIFHGPNKLGHVTASPCVSVDFSGRTSEEQLFKSGESVKNSCRKNPCRSLHCPVLDYV